MGSVRGAFLEILRVAVECGWPDDEPELVSRSAALLGAQTEAEVLAGAAIASRIWATIHTRAQGFWVRTTGDMNCGLPLLGPVAHLLASATAGALATPDSAPVAPALCEACMWGARVAKYVAAVFPPAVAASEDGWRLLESYFRSLHSLCAAGAGRPELDCATAPAIRAAAMLLTRFESGVRTGSAVAHGDKNIAQRAFTVHFASPAGRGLREAALGTAAAVLDRAAAAASQGAVPRRVAGRLMDDATAAVGLPASPVVPPTSAAVASALLLLERVLVAASAATTDCPDITAAAAAVPRYLAALAPAVLAVGADALEQLSLGDAEAFAAEDYSAGVPPSTRVSASGIATLLGYQLMGVGGDIGLHALAAAAALENGAGGVDAPPTPARTAALVQASGGARMLTNMLAHVCVPAQLRAQLAPAATAAVARLPAVIAAARALGPRLDAAGAAVIVLAGRMLHACAAWAGSVRSGEAQQTPAELAAALALAPLAGQLVGDSNAHLYLRAAAASALKAVLDVTPPNEVAGPLAGACGGDISALMWELLSLSRRFSAVDRAFAAVVEAFPAEAARFASPALDTLAGVVAERLGEFWAAALRDRTDAAFAAEGAVVSALQAAESACVAVAQRVPVQLPDLVAGRVRDLVTLLVAAARGRHPLVDAAVQAAQASQDMVSCVIEDPIDVFHYVGDVLDACLDFDASALSPSAAMGVAAGVAELADTAVRVPISTDVLRDFRSVLVQAARTAVAAAAQGVAGADEVMQRLLGIMSTAVQMDSDRCTADGLIAAAQALIIILLDPSVAPCLGAHAASVGGIAAAMHQVAPLLSDDINARPWAGAAVLAAAGVLPGAAGLSPDVVAAAAAAVSAELLSVAPGWLGDYTAQADPLLATALFLAARAARLGGPAWADAAVRLGAGLSSAADAARMMLTEVEEPADDLRVCALDPALIRPCLDPESAYNMVLQCA